MKRFLNWVCTAFALVAAVPGFANVGEFSGFGSRTAATGGASAAWGFDGYAAYANPAALALRSEHRFRGSYQVLYMVPRFGPINNVLAEATPYYAGSSTSNIDMSYRDTFGQGLGASYQLLPYLWNMSLGIVAFLPMAQTAFMDTGSAFTPEYVNYRSRTLRPQIEIGLGLNPYGPIYIGAGMHVGFGVNSSASLYLQTSTGNPSSMRFTTSLVPKASPFFSLLIAPDGDKSVWSAGATVRLPLVNDNAMYLNTRARALGNLAALEFNFNAFSALYYDPLSVEVGGSWQIFDWLRTTAQLDFVMWGPFQSAALAVFNATTRCEEGSLGACSGLSITPSNNPGFSTQNIFVPRIGFEFTLGHNTLRAGYAYKPSMFASLPTNSNNYLDPPAHRMSLGWGYQFTRFIGFDRPWTLDLHAGWHYLVPQSITKASANEIGAPGYTASGNLFGGGVSVSFAL